MIKRNRHTTRLKSWDYHSSGHYFVTICSFDRECIFGDIVNGKILLNKNGIVVNNIWNLLPEHHFVGLDVFQIMPNHIHGVVFIKNFVGVSFMKPDNSMEIAKSHRHMGLINQTPTLGQIIRYFKAKCSHELHKMGFCQQIWQRNYHERIIRNEDELQKIRDYVELNPLKWDLDKNNPINMKFVQA